MGLSDSLRKRADGVWRRILEHPFVGGIGDGSLSRDRFTFFLRQDYLFLIEYSRVLAMAAAKAPDLAGMTRFSEVLHATMSQEMELHRRYSAGFGISPEELERTRIAPGTSAYGRYLVSIAHEGSIKEIVAAVLPCEWGYSEIGRHLAATGNASDENPYAEWINTYASDEFSALGAWLRGYLDEQARGCSAAERRRLHEVFLTSSRYEYLFWEMAYNKERWPV
jgi:thiaminase/transcriptional activator TenA